MSKRTQAIAVSTSVWPLIEGNPTPCVVWSVHALACNLLLADGSVIGLLHAGKGPGSFHISLDGLAPFTQLLRPGMQGYVGGGHIVLPGMTVLVDQTVLWDPIVRWPHAAWTAAEVLQVVRDILPPRWEPQCTWEAAAHRQVRHTLWRAARALAAGEAAALEEAVKGLVGLGPGFTPAGDDALLGFMAGCWAFATDKPLFSVLTAAIQRHSRRTHRVSRTWLEAAAVNAFDAAWHLLADALASRSPTQLRTALLRIRENGATSGLYALLGFRAALQALHRDDVP